MGVIFEDKARLLVEVHSNQMSIQDYKDDQAERNCPGKFEGSTSWDIFWILLEEVLGNHI